MSSTKIFSFRISTSLAKKVAAYKRYISITDVCRTAMESKIKEIEEIADTVEVFECGILKSTLKEVVDYEEEVNVVI